MIIEIPGNPVAKRRPRFFRRGKHVGTYNDQETEEGKAMLLIADQWRDNPTDKPVTLDMRFFVARPKSHFGTGRNAKKLKPSAPKYPSAAKSDVDNFVKFYCDCMNGIVYRDDRQVVRLVCEKAYSYEPVTRIEIEIMEDD